MVKAPGVQAPLREAEATRRRLAAEGLLRTDLQVLKAEGAVVFPVTEGKATFDFQARPVRPRSYADLLPAAMRDAAPRAFDAMGDIAIVKVPEPLWSERRAVGEALLSFTGARVVFHDHGVEGEHRTRRLERIAGEGGSATTVQENGVSLHVDPAIAYFSPRLAEERARIAAMARPGERAVDLFGGVAPQGVQLARAGAHVVSIDINADATRLALRNAADNKVAIDARTGDAREVARNLDPADRVLMNLPHGAEAFLDVAARLARPGAMVHVHAIMPDAVVADHPATLVQAFAALDRAATVVTVRHVRAYSARDGHYVFDVRLA